MAKNIDIIANANFQTAMNSCTGNIGSLGEEVMTSLSDEGYTCESIYAGYGFCVNKKNPTDDSDYTRICEILCDALVKHNISEKCLHLLFDISNGNTTIGVVQRRI